MNKWLDGYKNKDYQFVVDDIKLSLDEKVRPSHPLRSHPPSTTPKPASQV